MVEPEAERAGCGALEPDLVCYHYGELQAPARAALERHLQECAGCRSRLAEIRASAAALDRLPLVLPSAEQWRRFEQGLEQRLAPLRAERAARRARPAAAPAERTRGPAATAPTAPRRAWARWLVRVAAAALIAALGVTIGVLLARNRAQQAQIAGLLHEVAEARLERGDLRGAASALDMLMVLAPELDRTARLKREALERLGADSPAAQLYLQARRAAEPEQARVQLAELLYRFPEHPLAEEAFRALLQRGAPSPRPLEVALLQPLDTVAKPLPGADRTAHYREEIAKLARLAAGAPPRVRAYALLRAARLADEQLGDGALAAARYREVLAAAADGPIRALAERRLAELGAR
ncbi:MAG: hypothetical protein KatS3mg102_3012 [Planctomycetota bacterium]|nr:MAG: hypothetical protein KatS3mg102_3012 [Planctomycetota bacterium]